MQVCSLYAFPWHKIQVGDVATWVQSIGTLLAYWVAYRTFVQIRSDRREDDLRRARSSCDVLLGAAADLVARITTHRDIYAGTLWKQLSGGLGANAHAMTITGDPPMRIFLAVQAVSALGDPALSDAAWRLQDATFAMPKHITAKADEWDEAAAEAQASLDAFRVAMEDYLDECARRESNPRPRHP